MESLKTGWDFFQNEVLGMGWLNRLIATILNSCGLDTTGKIGGSVQFFIYDTSHDHRHSRWLDDRPVRACCWQQ